MGASQSNETIYPTNIAITEEEIEESIKNKKIKKILKKQCKGITNNNNKCNKQLGKKNKTGYCSDHLNQLIGTEANNPFNVLNK